MALVVAVVAAGVVGYQLHRGDVTEETTGSPVPGVFTQLTFQLGPVSFPSLSPDGEFFVYASRASGNEDIYFQRVSGKNAINLTESSVADDTQPAFSPDGKRIAFRSERDGGGLFLMGATGESVKRLTDFGFNPAWSPDAEQIFFSTEPVTDQPLERNSFAQLWVVDVAGSETRLFYEGDAVQPHASPHGHRIAFWRLPPVGGQRDIWTIPAKGGEPRPVTSDVHLDWNPVWSPDGKHLYFSSDRGGGINLWRVPIDEASGAVLGPPEPVTSGGLSSRMHVSISRNGKRIVYVEQATRANLYKVGFDPDKEAVVGEPIPVTRGSRFDIQPKVSPDGEWLAFESRVPQEDIRIIRTDGTGERHLTDDPYKDKTPRWSPDGEWISFHSNRSGRYQIWSIRPDGSGLRQLTDIQDGEAVSGPWCPDGSRLAYSDYEKNSYIFDPTRPWEEQRPEPLPILDEEGWIDVHSWSPDTRRLLLDLTKKSGKVVGLFIYSFESNEYEQLTDSGWVPRWLNDNRRLLFQSEDRQRIILLDSETKESREIFSVAPQQFRVGLNASPDERFIFYSLIHSEADIWMLTLDEAS